MALFPVSTPPSHAGAASAMLGAQRPDGTIKGVVFDLDGVITDTAIAHSKAWKLAFDTFLNHYKITHSAYASAHLARFTEFTPADYHTYVDGKPRYQGVKSFLESRAFFVRTSDDATEPADGQPVINFGTPGDQPSCETTACAIGNLKNTYYVSALKDGITIFASTVRLMKELKEARIPMVAASSSKNCRRILEITGLKHFFCPEGGELIVDGLVIEQTPGMKGKPHPDMFLHAVSLISVNPRDAVVVEDALSGVQAGQAGNFTVILGIDRSQPADAGVVADSPLGTHASIVVSDLRHMDLATLQMHFAKQYADCHGHASALKPGVGM